MLCHLATNSIFPLTVILLCLHCRRPLEASLPDLALSDCDAVLIRDPSHTKARTRRLRILESLNRHSDAIVEVRVFDMCSLLQLFHLDLSATL